MFTLFPLKSFHRRRTFIRILGLVLAWILFLEVLQLRQTFYLQQDDVDSWIGSDPCEGLEGLSDVFVVLKTGATEAFEKVPVHLSTTLRCVPHYDIFSDYKEQIAGHQVHDALDGVNPDIVASHPDFEYYRRLQQHGKDGFSAQEVGQWLQAKNTNSGRDSPGWKLDKWKFLPLAEKALQLRPEAKWYAFVETDTYVLWRNVLEWLLEFDESKPQYLGMQMQIGDVVFAYGGAGFFISKPALTKVVEHRRAHLKNYDEFTAAHWAGDCVLGKALADAGVPLFWSWPNLVNEQPSNMDFNASFGNMYKKLWCHNAASYHHLSPADIDHFSAFERRWNRMNPDVLMRHADVFRQYILPRIVPEHADWDNLSEHDHGFSNSLDDCRRICELEDDCVQFSRSGRTCKTSSVLRLGHERSETAVERVTSGWLMDRVYAFVEDMESTCTNEDWVLP
ncbi:uncharacterized protein BCR38DRAFT_357312 [Pseudomassariella vexata]|uniref:N-acetylgalactosaminide beta-1,3-galactosyltransferase n=1 Tax=Pseudomassariella vexata TaxID=1141098 RepID=A0A1Y2D7L3_9PEZI|nr:uncharacterized protein BCR38DRAFT_357312 [Pseudomassariella vexata]ORY55106.1 hypothetical protein BCR38DRAFT_357312 [Pseudomassariella vexata]